MSNHLIELKNISKSFDNFVVIDNMNLYIDKKEFITLLGPSGCGKTTTLRMLAGFEKPSSGQILFDGEDITNVPPNLRRVNTVFQKYALFPHMNVFENVAFGLRIKNMKNSEIKQKVEEVLTLVNLKGFEKRSINALSGGQQQRIAIARALVNEPEVLLLDEPLGALDLKLRKEMQMELKKMQQKLGITFVFVTHDQEEAMTMSDTIVVMKDGFIQQIGTPMDIYNEPKNAYVADFIGESNIISGTMIKDELVEILGTRLVCVDKGFGENVAVDVVIRPEDLIIGSGGPLTGKVISSVFKGVHYEMEMQVNDVVWLVQNTKNVEVGNVVSLNIDPFDIHIMKKGE